jgi:5'-nucleotidase
MPIDLKNTRILVSNDDGIEAEGILVLEGIAEQLSTDVWTVAPLREQSGVSHSITLHDPIRIRKYDERRFAVTGTPSDAVLLGVMEILVDKRPGLILSGINRGANVAEDVTYSGTIAVAMEGTLLEIPSIAFSNMVRGEYGSVEMDWSAPQKFGADIVRKLAAADWPAGTLINVNFPGLPADQIKGIKVAPQGRRKIDKEKLHRRHDPRGREYFWIGGPGVTPFDDQPDADYHMLAAGYITITPVQLDLTNYGMLEALSRTMAT